MKTGERYREDHTEDRLPFIFPGALDVKSWEAGRSWHRVRPGEGRPVAVASWGRDPQPLWMNRAEWRE